MPQTNRPAELPAPTALPPVPEWVLKTPDEHYYSLEVYCHHGGDLQNISLTRDEFVRLKQFLVWELRGLKTEVA